jgi:pimeloyl-ACP methyl ester carboxylesterase
MGTFVLVHGAFCSASTWDLVRWQLEARGHDVLAMDLPCDDPDAGCVRYANVVTAALNDREEPVNLVGHSLGGLTIPLVAAARPVARMIFLAAFIPVPGRSFRDQLGSEDGMLPPSEESTWPITDADSRLMTWPPERALPALFADVDPDLARAAAASMRRQSAAPHAEVCPLLEWPGVPSSYILCRDDTQVGVEWARRTARERLRTTAIELPGGHMPMYGRPTELADALEACVSSPSQRGG